MCAFCTLCMHSLCEIQEEVGIFPCLTSPYENRRKGDYLSCPTQDPTMISRKSENTVRKVEEKIFTFITTFGSRRAAGDQSHAT